MADYAKRCGVGGIFHTDELPAYGITAADVEILRAQAGAGEKDCLVLVAGTPDQAACAAEQVIPAGGDGAGRRARGDPADAPRGIHLLHAALPGAARMYPETDVLPVTVDAAAWDRVPVPELLSDRAGRFVKEFGLDAGVAARSPSPSGSPSSSGRWRKG